MVVRLLAPTPAVGMLSLLNLCLLLLLLLTLYQTLNLMGKLHSGGLSGKVLVTCCNSRVAVPNCSCAFRYTKFMRPSLIYAFGAYRMIVVRLILAWFTAFACYQLKMFQKLTLSSLNMNIFPRYVSVVNFSRMFCRHMDECNYNAEDHSIPRSVSHVNEHCK